MPFIVEPFEVLINIPRRYQKERKLGTWLARNTASSLPVAPSGAKATNKHPPVITVLGQSLQLSPRVAISPHVCLKVTAPRVSWPAPLPFALRVPGEGLPCDVR